MSCYLSRPGVIVFIPSGPKTLITGRNKAMLAEASVQTELLGPQPSLSRPRRQLARRAQRPSPRLGIGADVGALETHSASAQCGTADV
eukprot:14140141-Alexandrium_andersonii.AAC.1